MLEQAVAGCWSAVAGFWSTFTVPGQAARVLLCPPHDVQTEGVNGGVKLALGLSHRHHLTRVQVQRVHYRLCATES